MSGKKLNIGARIQSRRKSMGISQEELAQRMGVSRQSVTKWETGASAPELERVVQLSDVLGVGLDYLLRDDAPSWEPARDAGNQPFALSAGANVLGPDPEKSPPPLATREAVAQVPETRDRHRFIRWAGFLFFFLGLAGLFLLWLFSRIYPVRLTDWDGSRHTGLMGFTMAHDIRIVLWGALAVTLVGAAAVAFSVLKGTAREDS